MIEDFHSDTYKIQEVFAMSGYSFPFWIRPWKTVNSVALITHQIYGRSDRYGKVRRWFKGEAWSLDKKVLLCPLVMIELDNQPGWLPVVDSQGN